MKKFIIILALFVFQQLNSQNSTVKIQINEMTEHITYETNQTYWRWSGVWYFKNKATNEMPSEYLEKRNITEIDSVNGIISKKNYKSIERKVTTTYTTNEEGWNWRSGNWTYKGAFVSSRPAKYKKNTKTNTLKTENIEGVIDKMTSIENIETIEFYGIQNDWIWNERRKMWYFRNQRNDILPVYKLEKKITRVW